LEAIIARLSERIAGALEPYRAHMEHVQGIPGGKQKAAEMLLAEIGMDRSRFPSAAHLASSAGICPGAYESAGKRKTGQTRQGNPYVRRLEQLAHHVTRGGGTDVA
jgi:transposase